MLVNNDELTHCVMSKIKCLLWHEPMKGAPINPSTPITNIVWRKVKSLFIKFSLVISWLLVLLSWIVTPLPRNSKALKKPWSTMCKKAKSYWPTQHVIIINLSWLVVDKAIIFLTSTCLIAHKEVSTIVITLDSIITLLSSNQFNEIIRGCNFNNKYTPATTIVLLWSNLLTGVGPSMAKVSQGWNKNWADLPAVAIQKEIPIKTDSPKAVLLRYCKLTICCK